MYSDKIKLWIVIAILALNSIGFSIALPLLPFIVGKFLPDHQVVIGMSALLSIFAVCTFFAAPIFGTLSDKYGRKSLLLISLLGSVIGYFLFGIGGALWVLIIARMIEGLTAGNISILFAYISDTVNAKERTRWFGYMGAAMGVGKIGGPALGGILGDINLALPFYITAGLIFISGIAVYVLLPESLPIEKRTKQLSLNSFNTFSHFKFAFNLKTVKYLFILSLLFYIGISTFQFNFTLFLKDIYQWTPAIIGYALTFVGIFEIATRAFILPRLLKFYNEKSIGIVGLLSLAMGLSLIFISTYFHSTIFILLAIIFIISGEGLFEPTYIGKLSQAVTESQQGKIQGVNQSLQSAVNALVPLGAAAIYYYNPGMLYLTAAIMVLIAIVMYKKFIPLNQNHGE